MATGIVTSSRRLMLLLVISLAAQAHPRSPAHLPGWRSRVAGSLLLKHLYSTCSEVGSLLDIAHGGHGWGAVTLREIAEESGVALSQLSYYFGNKDGLFAAVLERMQQEY